MGFTATTYPSLQHKVEARVSRDLTKKNDISKDEEDTIVSDVVEDLLQQSPTPPLKDNTNAKPPRASTSTENVNQQGGNSSLPGSWN